MRTLMSALRARVLIAVVLAVASGVLVYRALAPRPISRALLPVKSSVGTPLEHAALWLKAPTLATADSSACRDALSASVEPAPECAGRWTDAHKQALVDTLSAYLGAFSAPTPDQYLKIVDSEPTRWIDPSAHAWAAVDYCLQYYHQRDADRGKPRQALADLLATRRFAPGHSFARMGTGPRGARVLVGYSRTPDKLTLPLVFERDGFAEYEYWYHGGYHGLRLREPTRSAEQIVREHGGVLYAQSEMVVVTEAGKPVVVHGTWYWDPDGRCWLNRQLALESYSAEPIFY